MAMSIEVEFKRLGSLKERKKTYQQKEEEIFSTFLNMFLEVAIINYISFRSGLYIFSSG